MMLFVGAVLALLSQGLPAGADVAAVAARCRKLAESSKFVHLAEWSQDAPGVSRPLLVVADPPVRHAEEARRAKKPVVLLLGNSDHAPTVDALLALAADLAGKPKPVLDSLIVAVAPLARPVGDMVLLQDREAQVLARFWRRWEPLALLTTGADDAAEHRYALTYDTPRHAAARAELMTFVRDTLVADAAARFQKSGRVAFLAGTFADQNRLWEPPAARGSDPIHYAGLRNRVGVALAVAQGIPAARQTAALHGFLHELLASLTARLPELRGLIGRLDAETTRAGAEAKPESTVAVRSASVPLEQPQTVRGYVEKIDDGKRVRTSESKDYPVRYVGGAKALLVVRRPAAYLLPSSATRVVENLQRHGVTVEELREDIELPIEPLRTTSVPRRPPSETKPVPAEKVAAFDRVPAGTVLVRTAQPLGTLAAVLLEPDSDSGLIGAGYWGEASADGKRSFARLTAPTPLTRRPLRALAEDRKLDQPITFETVYGDTQRPNFSGTPVSGLVWLEDGKHFLQVKEGRLYKVAAASGRLEPFHDPDRLAKALARLPTIPADAARSLARQTRFSMDPARTLALFKHDNDLYLAAFDGSSAYRLTSTPEPEDLPSFSPDGKFVAFVRQQNLFVVDLATRTERQLTTDGGGAVSNGKADWVYFEEVYNRNWKAYWWSPDSTHIAFIQFDDTPLKSFTVVNHLPVHQQVETTAYPKAGDPNPIVRVGIVSAGGSPPAWVDLAGSIPGSFLITRLGWLPDAQSLYLYLQDRSQTWLDFCNVPRSGGKPTRLFRETTKAWVDDPGEPHFLRDGSFLLTSERSGYRHLYHFERDGKLKRPITTGAWEVRSLERVEEKEGWIYFTGTHQTHLASHLYRVRLDGQKLLRLTTPDASHSVNLPRTGDYFVDSFSNLASPAKVVLGSTKGGPIRTIDSNPVYEIEEYQHGAYEPVRISSGDGCELHGLLLLPPKLDPRRKYPVWMMTYGGPGMPSVRHGWSYQWAFDQMLAQKGIVVFRCDPRSASGKGAVWAWSAYRQLGVQELKDLETCVQWLCQRPYVDASRIGLSGYSYGGFLTAYALTHSKRFAAGFAGAPVTDWRNYDSIYTERYMDTPQNNPEGYDKSSVVKAAKDLSGRLLIVHGVIDDNVHVQNTLQLVHELQNAGKTFELMVYPTSRHGIGSRHMTRLMVDFIDRALLHQ